MQCSFSVRILDSALSIQGMNNGDQDNIYYAKKAKRDNVVGAWKPCKLVERIESNDGNDRTNIVKFMYGGYKKDVAEYEMAYRNVPSRAELNPGTRVIAKRRSDDMPYIFDDKGEKVPLIASLDTELYAGILAGYHESNTEKNFYLIFFDDGIVQYVPRKHIRRVLGNDGYKHGKFWYIFCTISTFPIK